MEAFSLLKYWRGGGGGGSGCTVTRTSCANGRTTTTTDCSSSPATTTTIITTASPRSSNSSSEEGSFFDLEFTLPDKKDAVEKNLKEEGISATNIEGVQENEGENYESDDGEAEANETMSSSSCYDSSSEHIDSNVSVSPPHPDGNLFFNGNLVPIEQGSVLLESSETNSKFPVKLLKSATKFRVLMALKFKKSKENGGEKGEKLEEEVGNENNSKEKEIQNRKFFMVKFIKVEEVPIVSLFTRDNSSKSEIRKAQKSNVDDKEEEEKRFSKDVMQKYLKMVKPLYIRVSKRYGEKLRLSGQLMSGGNKAGAAVFKQAAADPPSTAEEKGGEAAEVSEVGEVGNGKILKHGNLTAGLKVVRKHLGKSKSASLATAGAAAGPVPSASRRRDDSLLQQQDGIQSAILHCKKSFNASRDVEATILSRSSSDPSNDLSKEASCSREGKVG